MNFQALAIFSAFSLCISLLIETSSWWIRSFSRAGNIGLYISRTNIYLYGGRFFSLLFSTFIALMVDYGINTFHLATLLCLGFALTSVAHLILLNNSRMTLALVILIARLLRLSPPDVAHHKSDRVSDDWHVKWPTALASMFFGFGLSVPYVFASILPAYRLTIGNLGQVINSFGTLLLLFWVDQRLFAALDQGQLKDSVGHYARGRALGFAAVSIVFLIGLIATHSIQNLVK